jgi:hypothetical protein
MVLTDERFTFFGVTNKFEEFNSLMLFILITPEREFFYQFRNKLKVVWNFVGIHYYHSHE